MTGKEAFGKNKKMFYRIMLVIIGNTIIPIGLSFMRYAVLGIDPLACLNTGIAYKIGISFGTWQVILFGIMLIGVFIFDKSKIGFGTIYNIVTVGYASDFLLSLIKGIAVFEMFSIQMRIISLVSGFLILYFGAAIYIETDMGLAPYDAIAIIIAEKIKKRHWFRWIRIGTDFLCVIGGIATQSDVGIGTVMTVVCTGPIIAFYRRLLARLKIFQFIKQLGGNLNEVRA